MDLLYEADFLKTDKANKAKLLLSIIHARSIFVDEIHEAQINGFDSKKTGMFKGLKKDQLILDQYFRTIHSLFSLFYMSELTSKTFTKKERDILGQFVLCSKEDDYEQTLESVVNLLVEIIHEEDKKPCDFI